MTSPAMLAQATGSFSGNILDKSGSGVIGATVTATSQATGLARDGKTDNAGHYLIPLLPVGNYTVRVDAAGFQSAESKDLRLQVDEARELDFSLVPATVNTTVVVSGDAVAVETGNPSLGQVITSQEVAQLPLNGRDFVQLATLTAGATAETNPNSFFTSAASSEVAARGPFSLSVGGSRPNSTDWLLDGVDNNELTSGGIGILASIDDIQEFKVLTYTYSAEYGTRAGPTVLITTKSGTNQIHGTLYEFVRNTDLDAKSYFATSAEKFNLNQFGGAIGGPIRKDKTFLFVDGEQKDQLHAITFSGLVPTQAMINGDFSNDPFGNPVAPGAIVNPNMMGAPNPDFLCTTPDPTTSVPLPSNPDGSQGSKNLQGFPCNKIPSSSSGSPGLINNIGQTMMKFYPAPNANNPSADVNYVNEPVRQLNDTKFDGRLDQTLSAKDNLFGRFSYEQAFSYVPGGGPTGSFAEANFFGSNQHIRNHARNVALGETHVFSPTLVNQASFGYNRIFDYISSQGTGSCESAILGIPNANLGCLNGTCAPGAYSCGLVSTEFSDNYWALGDRGYSPFQGGTDIFSFRDDLDIVLHKHDLHVGIDFRGNQMNTGTEAFQDGLWIVGDTGFTYTGNPEADFLLGLFGGSVHDQTFGGTVTGRRWNVYRPFIEDDWRVTSSLTLNLGLAWDLTTPVTEAHNRLADYIPATGQLLIAGQNGVSDSAGVQMDKTALEPRVGMAWKAFGSEKTVLRAGYALYHDSAWSQGAQGLWQNPPFLGEADYFPAFSPTCPTYATSSLAAASPVPSFCSGLSVNLPANGGSTVIPANTSGGTNSGGFALISTPQNVTNYQGAFSAEPTNLKLGRVQQFNVNIQTQLPGNLVLTEGYAGSRGTHILVAGNDLNSSSPSACGAGGSYTLGCLPGGAPYMAPYNTPDFNVINFLGDVGKTSYDSLQVKLETKGLKNGLYALLAYTWSHTFDNGLTDGLGSELSAPYFPLPNWQHLDWSLSQINLANSFTGSVLYDLPFGHGKQFGHSWNPLTNEVLGGFQVTLIERISSGFPVPLIDSNNQSGVYFQNGGNDNNWNRPNEVANCVASSANHSKLQWINSSCFEAPPLYQLGNAARVPVSGPGFINTDFSVIKQFALPREGMGLNFRAEFFNLFNHPQFGMPENDLGAATTTQPTSTQPGIITATNGFGAVNSIVNNPRLVQLALKLSF
jgi:Carboxypeptidase regulatory-like domain